MKQISLILALLLLLGCLAGCSSSASGKDQARTREPAAETKAPAAETESTTSETKSQSSPVPAGEAIVLPNFSAETIDGGTFTLSDALRDHELVLINLFATWCGPCGMEFPYLQEAWAERSADVAVVALSIEPDDTNEVLQSYAEDMGLSFPIGREEGTDLGSFVTEGIPTTILVDRTGKVAAVEVGAQTSKAAFLDLFDSFTGPEYDPNVCTYRACAYDNNSMAVEGVVFNFCTDVSCTPVTTNAYGEAVFIGPPAKYHVEIVKMPDGLQPYGGSEFYTEPYGQTFWIPFTGADQ